MAGQKSKAAIIENHGQIVKITLPEGWEEGPSKKGGVGARSFREVHPPSDPTAMLCFYYRGLPASEAAGKAFKAVLDKPPHILTKTEILSLGEIMRGKDNPAEFSPIMIKTEELNGKCVLAINGRLVERQDDLKCYLIDADGTGKVVQEIYFQAPKESYLRYMKAAREAIESVVWKAK